MSYSDIDPDHYEAQIQEQAANYDYSMQFVDAEYTTPLNADCLKDADYRADLRWPADGRPFSYPPCYEAKADPDLMYSVYDSESGHWVDVPFRVAWLFYGLFTFMGQLLVFGISTIVFPQMLEFYIVWGVACLLSLPFLSYWWTKHARYKHYHLGRTHETHHTRVY